MSLSPGEAVLYQTHHSTFKALGDYPGGGGAERPDPDGRDEGQQRRGDPRTGRGAVGGVEEALERPVVARGGEPEGVRGRGAHDPEVAGREQVVGVEGGDGDRRRTGEGRARHRAG